MPAYSAAEGCYLDAIDALSKDAQESRFKTNEVLQKRKRRSYDCVSPKRLDGSVSRSSSEKSLATPESDHDESMESHDNFRQVQTPTRIGSHYSKLDLNAHALCTTPPPSTAANKDESKVWDFRATTHRGLIKTSSGTLLGAPPVLPRSVASMQLLEAPPTFQPVLWEEDDPFDDNNSNTFTFSTPRLSPVRQSKRSTSPTPRGRAFRASVLSTPFPPSGNVAPNDFYSPFAAHAAAPESRYAAHQDALQRQLRSHVDEVHRLKTETVTAQADRARQRAQKTLVAPTKLPQSRSFWSFKDPQTENADRTARVEKGRARGWTRDRFDPKKYNKLAEEAMAELKGGV